MKDVEKTNVERQNSSKRLRRRKRNFNIYAVVVLLLVLTAGITISYTFLFNINEITVSGESDMYTAKEIVDASGIREGDNLLRLDPEKCEQAILDRLLYVESASVDRDFPSSLEITVTRCEPAFNISYEHGTLLVSKKGKILTDNGFVTDGLPIIYGFEPEYMTTGKMLKSVNSHKDDALAEFMANLGSDGDAEVASVDMSDEFAITVTYKNGMVFRMGNWSDVGYKLSLAQNVMNDESVKGKKGYLTMIGKNQCGFRISKDPVKDNSTVEPATQNTTDADGNPIKGENNPDQEKLFEDSNNGNQQQFAQDGNAGGNDWNSGNADNGYGGDWNSYGGDSNDWNNYGNDWNNYGDGNWDSYGGYGNDWGDSGYGGDLEYNY